MSYLKFLVVGPVAVTIGLASLQSRAASVSEMSDQMKAVAANTLSQVERQSDVQTAKLMSQYLATAVVIMHLEASRSIGKAIERIEDPDVHMAAKAGTYAFVLFGTGWQAWNALSRVGAIPGMIRLKPGFGTTVKAVGGAAVRVALLGGVGYTVWRSNHIILLDKQDYEEMRMGLQADLANLDLQLPAAAKAKLQANIPKGISSNPTTDSTSELFKID